jgi:bla regulator protein blaR1
MMAELSLIAKTTLILAVALFATRAAQRASASVRSLILASGFGLVLVLPIASAIVPSREVQIPDAYATRFLTAEETVDQRPEYVGAPQRPPEPTPAPWRPSPRVLTRTAWLLGTVATVFPLVLGLWRLRYIRRGARDWPKGRALVDVLRESVGVRRTVAVILHDEVAAPMTCGWIRPAITMPADAPNWPASDVRQALLHELEHVRRQDWPVHILARLTCSLYWFHPAAWIAWRQLSLESERACDDAVVTQTEHTAYAEQLVSLARRLSKGRAAPLLSMADRRTLSTRIASILSTTVARGRVGTLPAALVLTAAAALAAAIAPVKAIGAQPRERDALTIPTSTDGPTFEVVSVKPNEADDRLRVNDWQPVTGRLVLRNLTPRVVLTFAYANSPTLFLPDERLLGVPEWADKERFTIEATAGHPVTAAEMQRMLRRVLVDRFGLRVHLEQREQTAYRLVRARPDRGLGPNLHPADEGKCTASRRPRGGSEAWGPQELICTTIDLLALELSERLGRPVLNQTGLTGLYDGILSYAPSAEELAVVYQLTPSELPPAAQTGPSLTTALREQLGLRLESTRAAIDVLVVDGLVRPTPNDAPGIQANAQSRSSDAPAPSAPRQDLRSAVPVLRFVVASIRPSPSGATRDLGGCCAVRYQPGGRVTATNVGVIDLIVSAYRLQYWQVSGGPSWADPDMMVTTDRYNVEAAANGDATPDQMREMLRALLADRFGLVLKPGTQTGRTYDLVVAGGGPKLQLLKVDEYRESIRAGGGRIIAEQMTMPDLARMLSGQVQTVVRDRTGLPGIYKFSVQWTPDQFRLSGVGRPAQNGEPGIDPNGPTLFDALRDQLGLRLQETKGPVESVVIERVDRPTGN